jgi:tetratricopeptide (TPR) repeat protein
LAQKLAQRTEGNPLFVADLLRYLQEREAIVLRNGSWNLTGPLARLLSGMPDTVLSMVQRGMEQLGEEERRLLAAASVQGYDFDTAVLAQALAIDAAELEDKLDKLERQSGFLRLIDEHELPDRTLTLRYRFVHVLYQDALYGSLRPARRASLSRSVAEALLHFYGTQAGRISAQLALLFEAARDFGRAAEYCLSASQNALMLFASSEAEALARRGIASIRSTPDTDEHARIELGLQQLLALALRNLKTYSGREGTAIQRRVLELAERLNDYETQFVVHYHVAWFFNTHQEFSQALVEAEQCLRIAELHDDPRMRAAAHLTLGDIMTHQGRLLECRRHLETVNETYRASDAPYYAQRIGTDPKANANGDLGLVLFYLGFIDQAMETLRRAGVAAQAARNPIALGVARICEILGYKHHGNGKLLCEATEDLEAICIKNEFLSSMLFFVNFGKGLVLASNGKPAEGLIKIDEAIAQVRDIEFTCAVPIMASGKGEVMRLAGHADLAVQFLDEQLAVCEKYGQHAEVPDILRVKGECLLGTLKDSPSVRLETEECFRQSMAAAARMGARLCELEAANNLAGLLDQSGRQQEATDVLAPVYSWFTEGFDAPALKRAIALLERLK